MLSRNGKNNTDGSFNWADAVCDAAIVSGLTFCVVGGSMATTGILYTQSGITSLILSTLGEFFMFLAVKRGLREKPTKNA